MKFLVRGATGKLVEDPSEKRAVLLDAFRHHLHDHVKTNIFFSSILLFFKKGKPSLSAVRLLRDEVLRLRAAQQRRPLGHVVLHGSLLAGAGGGKDDKFANVAKKLNLSKSN